MISTAIQSFDVLDQHGLNDTGLSINLSSSGLSGPMPDHLIWHAEAGRIDPTRLTLEILETTAISLSELDRATQHLSRLKTAGFKLFLDDFGMGYAGLAHLAGLNVDGIKIDRGLTSVVDENGTSLCILSALVQLAEQLGLVFIAEGAENQLQIDIVSGIGGKLFQGYAFARAMPLPEAVQWALDFAKDGASEDRGTGT